MNIEDLKLTTPALFRTAEEGGSDLTTEQYKFFTTYELVELLGGMGWDLYKASQQKTQKVSLRNPETTRHMVRFRNGDVPTVGGLLPEILLINSHDTSTSLRFMLGIFRLICSNGLVVPESLFNSAMVRHHRVEFEDVKTMITDMAAHFPLVFSNIGRMQSVMLDKDTQHKLALEAAAVRYPEYIDEKGLFLYDKLAADFDVKALLKPVRVEDNGDDLWMVFNRLQEKMLKGDFEKTLRTSKKADIDGVVRKARPISNIKANVEINQGMWTLAQQYIV